MRHAIVVLAIVIAVGGALAIQAQQAPQATAQPNGSAVFERACASCHQPGQNSIPTPEFLRGLPPESIVNALTTGKMSAQGATLSVAERAAVAQFLTGRAPAVATAGANQPVNRCSNPTPTASPRPPTR